MPVFGSGEVGQRPSAGRADLSRLAANAITGSFATEAHKQELLAELARAIAK